jgi:hypothetical protein
MRVECYGVEVEIPDLLIDKFAKDFDSLPGSGARESVHQLRESIEEILDILTEEPELLEERDYMQDFIQAMAMREAMSKLGILYDA